VTKPAREAAAYLSGYFISGRGKKATITETVAIAGCSVAGRIRLAQVDSADVLHDADPSSVGARIGRGTLSVSLGGSGAGGLRFESAIQPRR
jgi:hypothetical protein